MTSPVARRHPYYNYQKLWSYNAVFNFLVGGRGLGKTYGAKKAAIKAGIENGEQFVYLRRYKEELKPARNTFFADIEAQNEFPNHDFRIIGNEAQFAERMTREEGISEAAWKKAQKDRTWHTIGYFIALSVAQGQKSVAFPKVTKIIFDEFIIELQTHSRYLRDEVTAFVNFYNTVDRGLDKTRVLFLANSVSIMNPYFAEYEIRPDKLPEISTSHKGFILCHFPDSADFAKSIYTTRFGKFIAGTDYAKYAVGNQFEDAHESLIASKTADARYKFTLETKHGVFSVWYDMRTQKYYILNKRPGNERLFTLLPAKMDSGKVLMTLNDKPLQYLRASFGRSLVEFDKPSTRNAFVDIFTR